MPCLSSHPFIQPGCSKTHLPGYVQQYDQLKAAGAEVIVCICPNDPFVTAVSSSSSSSSSSDQSDGDHHYSVAVVVVAIGLAAITVVILHYYYYYYYYYYSLQDK